MTVTRTLVLTYGSYTLDGTGAAQLHAERPVVYREAPDRAFVEFEVVVQAATAGALVTATDALVAAFRAPRQNLTLAQGGSNELSWSQSGHTGFDAAPTCELVPGSNWNGALSRHYRVRIEVGRPADTASLGGRRETTVEIDYAAGRRRRVVIRGVYTALSGTGNASVVYAANATTWCNAVLSALGGSWKLENEDADYFETDKEYHFHREYLESVGPQAATHIRSQSTSVTIRRVGPGDSEGPDGAVLRLAEVTARLSAFVDSEQSTDLPSYVESARSHLLSRVQALGSFTSLALVSDAPDYNEDDNRFTLTQIYEAVLTAGWSQFTRTETTTLDVGEVLRRVWDLNRPWRRNRYRRQPGMTLVVAASGTYVGELDPTRSLTPEVEPLTPPPDGAEWVHMGTSEPRTRRVRGLDGSTFGEWEVSRTYQFEAAEAI